MKLAYRLAVIVIIANFLSFPIASVAEDPKELHFIFQKQKDPAVMKDEADKVAAYLSKELGMKVSAQVPNDYAAAVQALVSKRAEIAYVDSMAFLLARRDGDASLLLAEQRLDQKGTPRTDYDSVFVVPANSPLQSIEDVKKDASNLRMVFTSPTSTSGYIMAIRRLVNEKLLAPKQDPKEVFKSVSFGGSYTQALEQVIQGRGDICAVSYYTVEGESANQYLSAEQRGKIRILARTPGVPTHVITARGGLSEDLKSRVQAAILKLSKEQPALLKDVYGTATFVTVDENKHIRTAVEAVEYLNVPVDNLVSKG